MNFLNYVIYISMDDTTLSEIIPKQTSTNMDSPMREALNCSQDDLGRDFSRLNNLNMFVFVNICDFGKLFKLLRLSL